MYRNFGGRASQGGSGERFTKDTWIQRDICDRKPWPFADKEFDYVICSHVLEDLRDPLWVCSEIRRVGKRGYIETPSRLAESSRGWGGANIAGLSHHRWLIEQEGSKLTFLMKYHYIHSHWRLSLPASFFRSVDESAKVMPFFWEDTFDFEEKLLFSTADEHAELERFVQSVRPYPKWKLALSARARRVESLAHRVVNKARRTIAAL
jgi:ubiquinone/menaquinone biosynthesis C-methylase UbiE